MYSLPSLSADVWNGNGLCEYQIKVSRGLPELPDPSVRLPGWTLT